MVRRMPLGLVLIAFGCGPGPAPADGSESEEGSTETSTSSTTGGDGDGDSETDTQTPAETEGETETGLDCTPGDYECECLPDGTCTQSTTALRCTAEGICNACGFSHSVVSPPCRPSDCPTDCVIDFVEHGLGPIELVLAPFVSVENQLEVPWVGDACASEDGWTWAIEAEQIQLCGEHCQAWMAPALEGTSYQLNIDCPPGP